MASAESVVHPRVHAPSQWGARLLEVRAETPTVRTFLFDRPPDPFSFEPGQYLVLRLPNLEDPRGSSRTFSISSAPSDRETLSVTTREGPSPFKTRLFASSLGTVVELWGPFGKFVLDPARPSVLLGGGIGITPFRSMLRETAHRRSPLSVALLYSARSPSEIVYRKELEELGRHWPALKVRISVTGPRTAEDPWDGPTGRIDAATVREFARGLEAPLYYACGPPGMVRGLEQLLVDEAGVPPSDVRTELFRGY